MQIDPITTFGAWLAGSLARTQDAHHLAVHFA